MSPTDLSSPLIEAVLRPLIGIVVGFVLFIVPLFVVGLIAKRRRDGYKAEASEPFTEQPLRPAGESLRLRIETINAEFDEILLYLLFASTLPFLLCVAVPNNQRLPVILIGVLAMGFVYWKQTRRLLRTQKQLWNCKLGFAGERVVGEALNQLMVSGYRVFHDLPFDGFNIDHVLVGPDGVYCVETKTRRKPANVRGPGKAKVIFNGHDLEYPWGVERHGVDQVQRNASTLSQWLTRATGEPTPVRPLLVLPGWYVQLKTTEGALVLNEKQIAKTLPLSTTRPLAPDRFQRIVHQLTERCRLPRDDDGTKSVIAEFATAAPK
jgi:hypothetical protein